MKKLFATATALVLGLGALTAPVADAAAQDRDRYDRHDRYDRSDRYDRDRHDRRDRYDRDDRRDAKHWRRDDRRWDRDRRYSHWDNDWRWDGRRHRVSTRYVRPSGWYSYRWRVGHRLPSHWYRPTYYVDYRDYGLAPPPYGHRWVRVNDDVFLVALTSGLITYALHDIFYH